MLAMQYKISLPQDYNMDIIRDRVENNGFKTDGFPGLLFKAYLITDKEEGGLENSYCPLYVWRDSQGMNKFIFDGYYDNIIGSFGWHQIEIGVPSSIDLSKNFIDSKYVLEESVDIVEQPSLKSVPIDFKRDASELGKVGIYNPDKWKVVVFTFFKEKPESLKNSQKLYKILHISPEA